MKTYCHKVLKQPKQTVLTYSAFKAVFAQISYLIYSKPNNDLSHLPPVISVKQLFNYMKETLTKKNLATSIFDDMDIPGHEKELIKNLNA